MQLWEPCRWIRAPQYKFAAGGRDITSGVEHRRWEGVGNPAGGRSR